MHDISQSKVLPLRICRASKASRMAYAASNSNNRLMEVVTEDSYIMHLCYILTFVYVYCLFYRQEMIDHDKPQNVLAGHAFKHRSPSEESAFAGGELHSR